ncbi:cysteine proteinase, putative [Eimeria maxima]|uniref:Cysteine proteinase, putative n=1 Tax=Eimeria maxima TaxID=5804 RepID=U6MEP4_EIMMA|nr:cysteine proteinase, putative [Eimeria maxima]CDJ60125.1 cysteine proteinase, putative [Eimeria maxima]
MPFNKMAMTRVFFSLAVLVGFPGLSAVLGSSEGPGNERHTLGTAIDMIFSRILEDTAHELRNGRELQRCGRIGLRTQGEGGARCRRVLKGEPEEAEELLPFLLGDEDAMKLWRDHFRRHVNDLVNEAAEHSGANTPIHGPVLKTLAEGEFWSSRPAVSNAALRHLRLKMQRMKLSAAEKGNNPELAVSWEAEVSPRFKYHSIKDAKRLMGTYLSWYEDPEKPAVPLGDPLPVKRFELQTGEQGEEEANFDAREAFPDCKDIIGHVRDQGDCGSCWAFASTEALNDRFCIKTSGKHSEMLSPQHTTSCCDLLHCLSFGCSGGQPRMAWRWFANDGVVTGGDFNELHKGKTCWPYEVPFCQHHSDGPYPQCDGPLPKAPKCRKDCEEVEYTTKVHPFKDDLHFASTSYSVEGRDHIKKELKENGTLTGAFLVFEDFLMYKKGVYHHVTGIPMGGHAVKVIGYGSEEGRDYWLAVNSWNEYWGDKGTFKIQMGEAGIDKEFCGGEPRVPTNLNPFLQQSAQDL